MTASHPDSLQLAATIAAWEAEASTSGWREPAPVCEQTKLALAVDEPSLIGSSWDSWSCGDHWLQSQQVEEVSVDRVDCVETPCCTRSQAGLLLILFGVDVVLDMQKLVIAGIPRLRV